MLVQSARHGLDCLFLRIDGHRVTTGEKYTIIELGYAVLLGVDDSSSTWLNTITETIPAEPTQGRGLLTGSEGMAITSNPVVVALSYLDWWARNSDGFKAGRSLPIPSIEQAERIARTRRILNDFNQPYAGKLPSEWNPPHASAHLRGGR
jgi:hypothetical protein